MTFRSENLELRIQKYDLDDKSSADWRGWCGLAGRQLVKKNEPAWAGSHGERVWRRNRTGG